jgi:hypothetical protein
MRFVGGCSAPASGLGAGSWAYATLPAAIARIAAINARLIAFLLWNFLIF